VGDNGVVAAHLPPDLSARRAWFLDRDGTLTLAERKLPAVDAFLARLRERGRTIRVATNNSSKSRRRHWENFRRIGLDLREDEVLVSLDAALAAFRASGTRRLHLVANGEVTEFVRGEGFDPDASDPEAILLTYDTELTYGKLTALVALLRRGVPFFATHTDIVCPTPEGPVPDIGTTLRTLAMTLGEECRPLRTFGKPSPDFVRPVLDALGLTFEDAVIVGDRLYTDIAAAAGTGMASVLVLTGETTREMYAASEYRADYVVEDLSALLPLL
jgi:HAD superfamily hydrolase (TIGR01450 family)